MRKLLLIAMMLGVAATGCMARQDKMEKPGTSAMAMESRMAEEKTDTEKNEGMGHESMSKDGMRKEEMSEDGMRKGEMMKDGAKKLSLSFQDINGESYERSDRKTYIKVWASWCPVCLDGLSDIDKLSAEKKDYEVITVVSPGMIGEKNKEDFIKWFKGLDYKNMKVLLDEEGQLIRDYGIRSMPTNIIVDSTGEVVKVIPGQLPKELVDGIFKEVM